MITENLSTLKIHKLTQEQYDRELEAGRIDSNALYLTPDSGGNTEICIVTVTEIDTTTPTTYESDKTSQEIYNAYSDDIPIYCVYRSAMGPKQLTPIILQSHYSIFSGTLWGTDSEFDGLRVDICIEDSTVTAKYTMANNIPTKVSELENDLNYVTYSEAETVLQNFQPIGNYVTEEAAEQILSAYAKTTVVEAQINNALATKADVSHAHSEYAPMYSYGTTDLTAGSSALETGKLYFVYE